MIENFVQRLSVDNLSLQYSFQSTQYYFSLAAFINLTRLKLVNDSYITQQSLILHVPDK